MGHIIRHVPAELRKWTDAQGRAIAISDITVRCIQGMYLLAPTDECRELINGVLAVAQRKYDFELYAHSFMSNHGSYMVGVRSVEHQAAIMEYVHGRISREIGREEVHGWDGPMWGRRGSPILCVDDADAVARLRYTLANGTKENGVKHPDRWPGAHSAPALCHGKRIRGKTVDRTALGEARRRAKPGEVVREADFTQYLTLRVSKLPCMAHLSDDEYRGEIRAMCRGIAEDAARERAATGARVVGRARLQRQDPHHVPARMKKTPRPLVHCADAAARAAYRAAYAAFVDGYRAAMRALRAGLARFQFPEGGMPPAVHYLHAPG